MLDAPRASALSPGGVKGAGWNCEAALQGPGSGEGLERKVALRMRSIALLRFHQRAALIQSGSRNLYKCN